MALKKTLFTLGMLMSSSAYAAHLHFSPEVKIGPYAGSGISGAGLQLGVADTLGFDAIYLSYSHTSAEFLTDKDRLKSYRLGAQYQFPQAPMLGIQFELGAVEYEGSRTIFSSRYRSGTGVSTAASWVFAINDTLGLRAGLDVNYIDKDKTFLSSNLSATLNTGITLRF